MKFITSLFIATLISQGTALAASDGEKVYKKINCAQCHGKDGLGKAPKKKDGSWKLSGTKGPQIAGLDAKYIEEQMIAIKEKKRKSKYTTSMMVKIKKLTAEDIKALATYISKDLNPKAPAIKGMLQK